MIPRHTLCHDGRFFRSEGADKKQAEFLISDSFLQGGAVTLDMENSKDVSSSLRLLKQRMSASKATVEKR